MTRQAVSSIESNVYLPTTAVALRLASVLACRVEDLFSLAQAEDIVEGTLIGRLPRVEERRSQPVRVKVSMVGKRTIVRPVTELGEQLSFTIPADGYLVEPLGRKPDSTVRVKPSRDRQTMEQEISVAGCDPAIFLAGEHLRRQKDRLLPSRDGRMFQTGGNSWCSVLLIEPTDRFPCRPGRFRRLAMSVSSDNALRESWDRGTVPSP
ncbi:MAG: hypothetical protein HP477_05270 [Nitrospira sp.]|nr:hypothetical protein [Nitrospira sp.]